MAIHNFAAKLRQGEEIEQLLDDYLDASYVIRRATAEEQRQGIDRWLTPMDPDGPVEAFSIDYKADWLAARTGHVFIETVSVDRVGKSGWALSSRAQFIFYYIPQRRRLYVLSMAEIQALLPQWALIYQTRIAHNEGYESAGVLVPLSEIARIAEAVIDVEQ
jgi:hypothetical protein